MDRKQEQKYLNFTRGNKLYILREAAPLLPHSRMIRVLRAIDEKHWQYSRDESTVTLTHRQIASYDGMSVPTARRGIEDLIEYDFLIKPRRLTVTANKRILIKLFGLIWTRLLLTENR